MALGLVCACWAGSGVQAAEIPIRVTAHRVNLRATPQPTGDLLGQVDYDTRLTAREIGEEWVEIVPPDSLEMWVKKEYVVTPQNTIGANRVNIRAGASINYQVVDTLPLGTPVVPIGEFADWLKIKPPSTARVWISRQFVETLSPETAPAPAPQALEPAATPSEGENSPQWTEQGEKIDQDTEKTAKKSEKRASKRKKTASKTKDAADKEVQMPPEVPAIAIATPQEESNAAAMPDRSSSLPTPIISPSAPTASATETPHEIPLPPPKELKLIPLDGQGRLTEVEGLLRAAPLINEAPTHYRVVRWQNNRWQILCHVYGDAGKLRTLKDKRVRVRGREYWIQKAAAPVLLPDRIQEIPGDAVEAE